ncbi:MAG: hypothetical protein LBP52_00955 [Burkholderiaceae bacterium]|nr:hypothetical protein [Burkholderiaceae bacterium]
MLYQLSYAGTKGAIISARARAARQAYWRGGAGLDSVAKIKTALEKARPADPGARATFMRAGSSGGSGDPADAV